MLSWMTTDVPKSMVPDIDHSPVYINESYSWWMVFNDPNIQKSYEVFRNGDFSLSQFVLQTSFFTILLIISTIQDTYSGRHIEEGYLFAFYLKFVSSIFFIVVVIAPLWITTYWLCKGWQMDPSEYFTIIIEFSVLVGGSFSIGTTLYAISIGADVRTNFSDTVAFAVIFPSVMTILFRHIHLKILFLSWIICFTSLIVSFVITKEQGKFIFLASILLVYQTYSIERRTICLFLKELSKSRLKESIANLESQKDAKFVEDLRHMIGNVAHDLKTPTQSFAVCLEQLELSIKSVYNTTISPVSNQINSILQDMSENILQLKASNLFMSMMINRTIDFTKASHGKVLAPHMSTVDVLESLHWPLTCMRSMQTSIPINLETPPQDLAKHIITDGQWLQENILCLISNAIKYSMGGSIDIRIILLPGNNNNQLEQPSPPMIQFEVEDHGIGIPVDIRHQLFAPFKQAQRLAGGTGLGLYSMLKRMDALNGSCGVEDRRDGQQGSLFWFKVPYVPDIHTTLATNMISICKVEDLYCDKKIVNIESKVDYESRTACDLTTALNILLVDDSVPILKTLGMALKKMGHVVQTAGNGAEALVYLIEKGEVYDVVVMDLQMPIMDGMEAVRRLRAHERVSSYSQQGIAHDHCPFISSLVSPSGDSHTHCMKQQQLVIGSSANSDEVTRREALAIGMDDFLPKPYPATVLIEKIFDMITKKYNIDNI